MQVSLTIEYTPQYTPLDLMSINVGMKQTTIWIYWRYPIMCDGFAMKSAELLVSSMHLFPSDFLFICNTC
jgi:hypothetical protein